MIKTEEIILEDGGILIKTFSDSGFKIRQDETGNIYDIAVDPQQWPRTYTETEEPIEPEEEGEDSEMLPIVSPSEAEEILSILLGGQQ